MTKLFLALVCISLASTAPAAVEDADDVVPSADNILLGVIQQLPADPIHVTGELFVRRRRGVPVATYGFEMIARWGASTPQSQYTISDAFGQTLEQLSISHGEIPSYTYAVGSPLKSAPLNTLSNPIQETDITWVDLTLSFLWWTGARHAGEESIRSFDCFVIEVDAPTAQKESYKSARLWISKKTNMLLQAEGLDATGQPVRRLWVRSVKKIDNAWMIKDMEIQKYPATQRTKLQVENVQRLEP